MSTESTELDTTDELKVAKIPSVAEMLYAVIERGISAENVAALESLTKLYERMQEKEAQKEFNKSFVAMQAEMRQVRATQPVVDKYGKVKFRVALPEEIDAQARPIYQKYGFAVSFSEGETREGKIVKVCHLKHVAGHEQTNSYAVRPGAGPPGATESQADVSGHSYARRGALCDALNIVIDHAEGMDARLEGGTITDEQAFELERRVVESNSNRARFLDLAGVKTFAEIATTKYDILDRFLASKERKKA